MAVVLCKKCNAADVRFRARPTGLTVWLAFLVAAFRQAPDMTSKLRRDCDPDCKPESPYNGTQAPPGYAFSNDQPNCFASYTAILESFMKYPGLPAYFIRPATAT